MISSLTEKTAERWMLYLSAFIAGTVFYLPLSRGGLSLWPVDRFWGILNEFIIRFKEGGNVMWVLLLLSVMFAAYTVERLVNLRQKRIVPESLAPEVDFLWREGRYSEIVDVCAKSDSVLSRIIMQIVKRRDEDPTRIHSIAGDVGAREMRLQLQRAYPLAIAATLAPLLGLLGTVSGMIDAFNTVAIAGSLGNPALLADSISKAMVTTGGGLIVAIPSLAAYHYFKGHTMVYAVQLEETVSDLLFNWFPGIKGVKP